MFGLSSFFHTCVHNKGRPLLTFRRELSDQVPAETFAGKQIKNPALVKSNVSFAKNLSCNIYIYIV